MKIVVVIIDDIKYRKGIEFIEDIVVMTVRTFDFYEFCVLISVNHTRLTLVLIATNTRVFIL